MGVFFTPSQKTQSKKVHIGTQGTQGRVHCTTKTK